MTDATIGGYKRVIRSSNYGASFAEVGQIDVVTPGDLGNPNFIAISGDGSYWFTATGNLQNSCGGGRIIINNILVSDNYASTVQFANGAVSYYGQYMLLVGRTCSNASGSLYLSSNYGANGSWNLKFNLVANVPGPVFITNSLFYLAATSGSGKYMMAAYYGTTSGTVYYNIAISSDFGLNWTLAQIIPSNTLPIDSISISFDGTVWFASIAQNIYYSIDFGSNWNIFYTDGSVSPSSASWISLNV